MSNFEFTFIQTNGVILHTAVVGPKSGRLVILLHGFPEFWYGWRHQVEPLVEAGYRVVIPDQRGYNLSQKPRGAANYQLDLLRDDVIGLIRYFERDKAVLIGHDWGGIVAWHLASSQPQYVEKLVVMSCPHPAVMKNWANYLPLQWIKSLYMLFFQIPILPERLFGANDFTLVKKLLVLTSKTGAFTKEELNHYQTSWEQPGGLCSMLNWYRAMRKGTLGQVVHSNIEAPVLIIWGNRDSFLSLDLAEESSKLCRNVQLIMIDATHWVHIERPQLINQLITDFL
ncbi:alpha/beta fold hydrolase [Halalkalibacter alkalisediminis]|uniref:Alpha/beta fold hydrolase n=1 Tax=Halalkalibacter alkalisediminis TaxID=935616 RepID=A0ABV6NI98_9BACI|nr:alpha/beta hydrolase [Halalkalibacter alkalisediminis]